MFYIRFRSNIFVYSITKFRWPAAYIIAKQLKTYFKEGHAFCYGDLGIHVMVDKVNIWAMNFIDCALWDLKVSLK